MTPAERLAKAKPYRTRKGEGNDPSPPRYAVWKCTLRERRESLRLSLRDVAAAVGLSVTGYWQIEKGGDVMLTTARRIAAFFGMPIEQLWPNLIEKHL